MQPLARLRLQLTAWYAGVLTLVLVLLGAGLFVTIRQQVAGHLDRSLRAAAAALEGAARIRETERAAAHGAVVDAVDELHIPDRSLYLLDERGGPIKPADAPNWVREAARQAVASEYGYRNVEGPDGRELRLYAERFTGTTGTRYVAAVVADRMELKEEYAALLAAFAVATLAALLLVGGGGYLLVRKSTAPVERSMEHMRRFMADAAHELRTPIAILRTQAEVALTRPRESEHDRTAFQSIERETARVGRIVGDLLTLARADAGERPVTREPLYLDDAAAEAVDNAIKYTPQGTGGGGAGGGGRVHLDVSTQNGTGTVVVTDTGVGIAADQLPFVFDRFYRAEPARRDADGAGLGLAIARWIAEEHGARIDIASQPGAGTRVTVTFPLSG